MCELFTKTTECEQEEHHGATNNCRLDNWHGVPQVLWV